MADYPVIAECVDSRTGKRFYPGDDFTPPPTDTQLARLVAAGCLAAAPGATDLAGAVRDAIGSDNLSERTVEQLKDIAKSEKIDLGGAKLKPDIITAIRQARAMPTGDGLDGLPADTLRMLAGGLGVTFDATTDPTTLAAAIRSRRALGSQAASYESDGLSTKPLGEQTLEQLQLTASHEGADVTIATADAAALITAIELKRQASA